jgi:glycosyltransferase involved in cell wall biosynthesis
MNVLHLVDTLGIGGAERVVVHLARGFEQRGHKATVVCLYSDGPMSLPLRKAGIRVETLNKPNGLHPTSIFRLARLLKQCRIEAVHTHNPQVHHYGVAASRLAGIKTVVNTLHGVNNFQNSGRAANALYGIAARWTGSIVAVSEASKRFFESLSYLPKEKLSVVYNGIPLEPLLAIGGPPDAPLVFGIVGRLVPIKDQMTALRAFALICKEAPDCRLEFAGDGPLLGELEAEARRLSISARVTFHGAVQDIPGFLARTGVFVLSSLSEGMPMSLLEAMAAGRPVVATSVGGVPELVETARCGWLCRPGDPEAMARVMREASDRNARMERGARGRAFALEHCSLERMVQRYEDIFRSLM